MRAAAPFLYIHAKLHVMNDVRLDPFALCVAHTRHGLFVLALLHGCPRSPMVHRTCTWVVEATEAGVCAVRRIRCQLCK